MKPIPIALIASSALLAVPAGAQEGGNPVTQQELDEAMAELDGLREALDAAQPGGTGFLLSGYATGTYVDSADGNSSFEASFAPVFLWRPGERTLFEGEVELESGSGAELEYAHLSYLASDWLTLGAGQFLSPFGVFNERFHPSWINPLPNAPLLAGHDGLVPVSVVGAQARGGVPVGDARVSYALFVSNGPLLNDGTMDPTEAGMLHFDAGPDGDQNKAVGGRLGFIPRAGVEVGVSAMGGKASGAATNQERVSFQLIGVDLSAQTEVAVLSGRVRFDGEWVQSSVGDARYLPGTPGGFTYDNDRGGGWGQLSYRPSLLESELQDLELILRYDWLDQPTGWPGEDDHARWTLGIDWWLDASTVVKFAVDRLSIDGEDDSTSFLGQVALGF